MMEKENLQQLIDLVAKEPDLKGSFIEELFQTMKSGKFTDPDEDVDPLREKVIGEMNDLEKALSTLCNQCANIEAPLVDRFRRVFILGGDIDPEEKRQMQVKLRQTRNRFKIASNFLWENINDRFGEHNEPDGYGFGLRTGYKIVLRYDNNDRESFEVLSVNPLETLLVFRELNKIMEE